MEYIGKGDARMGVPARNLSKEEVKHFGASFLLSTGLYRRFKRKKKAPVLKSKKETNSKENE